ncbi:PIN domain-containing protein [Rhodococcus koreensis]|uniref:PIN domain-containing protein n=1 Tax=Rhodococcus koreensis TaxID=99653 RepID=UPI00366AF77F
MLIRLAQTGLVHARWTDRILDETFENLAEDRPDIPAATLAKLRELMNRAVPDCLVTGYEALIPALTLPDEDDRHVLAAAIRAGAQVIVTANLRDFPDSDLAVRRRGQASGRVRDGSVPPRRGTGPSGDQCDCRGLAQSTRDPADVCDRLAAAGPPISAAAFRR